MSVCAYEKQTMFQLNLRCFPFIHKRIWKVDIVTSPISKVWKHCTRVG